MWGRGTLDMKGQVAATAVAFASLAREGFRPAGDLIFVAAADEEVGKRFGLEWLVHEHPDAVRADYSLNEGGGDRVAFAGRVFYLCSTAEKMSAPFLLRVHGRSGHASMPGIADNALVKAGHLIDVLGAYRPPRELIPEVVGLLRAALGEAPPAPEALERARDLHPLAAELVEPLLSLTLSPTMVRASERRNVIPAVCEVTVDCRLLPGRTPEDVEPLIREVLGPGDYDLEWIERSAAPARHRRPRSGRDRDFVARARARRAACADLLGPASRTVTGCARRSARSRTASSPRAPWRRRWRRA